MIVRITITTRKKDMKNMAQQNIMETENDGAQKRAENEQILAICLRVRPKKAIPDRLERAHLRP